MLVSSTAAPLLATCPYINQVLIEPKRTSIRFQLISERQYDCAFVLRKSVSMALMCKMAGIRTVVGYDKQRWFEPLGYKRWGLLLDRKARYPSLKTIVPQPISHLSLLKVCDLEPIDNHLELWTTHEDQQQVSQWMTRDTITPDDPEKPLAVLHTVSASHGKSFPIARFIKAVQTLDSLGYQIICTGTKADQTGYEQLETLAKVKIHNWAGLSGLRQTVALYEKTSLILTVDSSPIHLAAAAGIPDIIGVFGPTNEKQWGPHSATSRFWPVLLDLPCRPCYAKICSHNSCRTQLTDDMIDEAVHQAHQARINKILDNPVQSIQEVQASP